MSRDVIERDRRGLRMHWQILGNRSVSRYGAIALDDDGGPTDQGQLRKKERFKERAGDVDSTVGWMISLHTGYQLRIRCLSSKSASGRLLRFGCVGQSLTVRPGY